MRKTAGFTLIELMIVLTIIGILLGIAIPAYSSYQRNARRSDAKAALAAAAQICERYFSLNGTYGDANASPSTACITLPASGVTGDSVFGTSTAYYTFAYDNSAASTPSVVQGIKATPKGAQAADTCYIHIYFDGRRKCEDSSFTASTGVDW